jgi:hypothetical protein
MIYKSTLALSVFSIAFGAYAPDEITALPGWTGI